MADYRDPKVTTTDSRKRGMTTWIGVAVAAIVILALIWWWSAGDEPEVVEPVAPATEGTATEEPATTEPATPPAQQ